jgi:hypothetical protein
VSDDEKVNTSQIRGGILDKKTYEILLINLQVLKQTRDIRNHNITRDYLKKHITDRSTGELILDMKIRWYSTHIMLERFLKYKEIIQVISGSPEKFKSSLKKEQQTKLKNFSLNHNQWDLLDTIKSLLEPFRQATTILSGQTYPTLGLAYYVIRCLRNFLLKDDYDESDLFYIIKNSLTTQFMY